jgi:hypothetical protein
MCVCLLVKWFAVIGVEFIQTRALSRTDAANSRRQSKRLVIGDTRRGLPQWSWPLISSGAVFIDPGRHRTKCVSFRSRMFAPVAITISLDLSVAVFGLSTGGLKHLDARVAVRCASKT